MIHTGSGSASTLWGMVMRLVTCLLLALGTGIAGLALRAAVPVTPADDGFRQVMHLYWSQDGAQVSNKPETSAP
ncbi:hypothetical protein ACFQWF_15755 [Methylorubrum suomiense]|uniref:Uncharacterized protein n=2 Tax=Methylorubrum suomiense TaxID=144191 RepID=A0ABQ4V2I9_9HYPH|nr:hypothetical protein BGCPKDLD_5132 [Methylorubrum suomiense]